MVNGFEMKIMVKSHASGMISFSIYQLISIANSALFEWNLAGLAKIGAP